MRSNSPSARVPTPSTVPRTNSPTTPTAAAGGEPRQYRTKKPNGEDTPVSPSIQTKSPLQRTGSPNNSSGNLVVNNNNNNNNNTPINPIVSSLSNSNGVVPINKRESPSPSSLPTIAETPEVKKDSPVEVPVVEPKAVITSEIPSLNPNAPTRVGSRVRSISDSTLRKLITDNHEMLNQEKCRMSKIIDDASKRNQQIAMPEAQLKKRKHIINEILSTELQFNSDLQILTTVRFFFSFLFLFLIFYLIQNKKKTFY